jgi:hypothetical protein
VIVGSLVISLVATSHARAQDLISEIAAHWGMAQDVAPGRQPTREQERDDRSRDVFQVKTVEVQPGQYREEAPVGEYDQPLWTTFRRFPSTRVYLQTPPGGVQFEQWFEFRNSKSDGDRDETRLRQELEFGLGHRLQLDLYMREQHIRDQENSTFDWQGYSAELRYALADWDEIWGNPTLYLEVASHDEAPDSLEYKLLFGGQISPGWHWGSNLVYEHETGGELTNEYEITAGVSRIVKDESLALGGELKAGLVDTHDDRGDFEEELLVGPSLQYRPTRNISMDFAPLVGIGSDSPEFQGFFVLGYSF